MSPSDRPGFGVLLARALITQFFRLMFHGFYGLRAVNAPTLDGSYIVAPNHTSFLDPMLVQAALKRHITFVMDQDRFSQPGLNWLYRLWGAIPLPEGGSAVGALKLALAAAARGEVVAIFPEGRVSDDGKLNEGHAGVALLMQKAGVPVIPTSILGAYAILPRHASFLRPGRILVAFGRPILPRSEQEKRESARVLRDHVMGDIRKLLSRYARRR